MSEALPAKFHQERASGIGGSDIVHLFSLEPYGCARRLMYEKLGVAPDYPFEGNAHTARGTRLESFVVREFEIATGFKTKKTVVRRHVDHRELLVHPDRLIIGQPEGVGILEVKCPGREAFFRIKKNGVPQGYILQMQHSFLVTGYTWGMFAICHADSWQMLMLRATRDDALCETIKAEGVGFWKRRLQQRASEDFNAPRLQAKSQACQKCPWRMKCQGQEMIRAAFPDQAVLDAFLQEAGLAPEEKPAIPEDPRLADLARQVIEAKDLAKEAEQYADECADKLREAMGDRPVVRTTGALVHYSPYEKKSIDSTALKRDEPAIAKKYTKSSVVRPLRVVPA